MSSPANCSEAEPAGSGREESSVRVGWLPSLTFGSPGLRLLLLGVHNFQARESSAVLVGRRRDAPPCGCVLKPPGQTALGNQPFLRVPPKHIDSTALTRLSQLNVQVLAAAIVLDRNAEGILD
jgi:hypothetical protein